MIRYRQRDAFIGRKTTLGIHDNEGVAKCRGNGTFGGRERREIQSLVAHTGDIEKDAYAIRIQHVCR